MVISYDKEAEALNIKIGDAKIVNTTESNNCIIDYDKNGEIVNIEVLYVDKSAVPKDIFL